MAYGNENISDFLEELLSDNLVTWKNVYDYAEAHYSDLMNMESIFDLEKEDHINYCLAIPKLLDPLAADDIIDFFRKEYPDNLMLAKNNPDLQHYKVPLLSAFVYNTPFFAMAWNWCALIRDELQAEANNRKDAHGNLTLIKGNAATVTSEILSLPFKGKIKDPIAQLNAASGKAVVRNKREWLVDDTEDKFIGYLRLNVAGNEARFNFKFGNSYNEPPCSIVVTCKTHGKDGEKEYPDILIDKVKTCNSGELIMMSDILENFDYSGVEIIEIIKVEFINYE